MGDSTSLKHFIRSSAIFTVAGVIVNILGYAFHILAGRYLGPSSYSEITAVFAYGMLLSVPIMVISVVIVSQSGGHADQSKRSAFLSSLRTYFDTLAHSYLLIAGLYLGLALFGYFNHLSLSSAIIMPAFVLTLLYSQLYPILLQASKRFTPLAFILIVTGVLKLAAASVAPFFPSASLILLLLVISNLVQIYLSRRYLPRSSERVDPFSLSTIFSDPRLKLTFFSLLGLVALNNLDVVLSKQFLQADFSGMYGVWSLFAKAITYSFIPLSSVALVFFTDAEHRHNSVRILVLSLIFLSFTGVVSYFAFALLSTFLVTDLMGPSFAPLLPLLPFSAIFGTVYSMIYLLNNYYLSVSSKLSLLPLTFAIVTGLVLLVRPHTLSSFTIAITVCGGLALLTYPLATLWRTIRTSAWRSR